jgi:hypothetical protein
MMIFTAENAENAEKRGSFGVPGLGVDGLGQEPSGSPGRSLV